MQPPYTVQALADAAGTGQHAHTAPPPAPTCAACGCAIPTGRIYCSRRACLRAQNSTGKTGTRHYEPFPTIGTYNA